MTTDNLPDAVKAQLDKAEQVKAEMAARRATATPTPAGEQEQNAPAQVVAAVAPTNPSPAPEAQGVSTAMPPDQNAKLMEENASLRHRLTERDGTHGGEIQKLKTLIVDLQGTVAEQQRSMEDRHDVTPNSGGDSVDPNAPAKGTPEYLKYVTEELKDQYGDEFFDVVSLVARGVAESETRELREVADKVNGHEARRVANEFWQDVESLAPGALAINGDKSRGIPCAQGWGSYLDEPTIPGGMVTRREEIERAISSGSADVFAAIVKDYQTKDGTKPQSPQARIREQAAPKSTGGASSVQDDDSRRQIMQSEVDDFTARAARGEVSVEEADEKMNEFAIAHKQGRILVGA